MKFETINPDKLRFTDDETKFPKAGATPFIFAIEISNECSLLQHITCYVIEGIRSQHVKDLVGDVYIQFTLHDPELYHREENRLKDPHYHWSCISQPRREDVIKFLDTFGDAVALDFRNYVIKHFAEAVA